MTPHIAVIRTDALGDAVLSCYLLASIKARWPHARLTVIAQPAVCKLLRDHTAVDGVLAAVSGYTAAYQQLRTQGITHSIFAHMNPAYIWGAYLAKIPIRVGDKRVLTARPFLTHAVALDYNNWAYHDAQFQTQLLDPFMPTTSYYHRDTLAAHTHFPDSRHRPILQTLPSDKPLILLHPKFGDANRGWPYYAALCQQLQPAYTPVIIGTASPDLNQLAQATGAINLAGKTSLTDLCALFQVATAAIGPDTGPMHLANLLNCPVVYISPTKYIKAWRWGPFKPPYAIVKDTRLCPFRCHPYKDPCTRPNCITPLSVTRVMQALQTVLTTPHHPQNPMQYALAQDGRIAIHCSSIQSVYTQLYHQYQAQGIPVWLTTTRREIYQYYNRYHYPCFYSPAYRIATWCHQLQHVTVWHTATTPWHQLIAHTVALRTDALPCINAVLSPQITV